MALNDQLQVAAVQKEKYGTIRTEPWGTPHTMEPGDKEEDPTRTCCIVAGLTGRIETIVVLIPRSDKRSPVYAEEYHDRPCRRPPIAPAKQRQTNLLRRLQELRMSIKTFSTAVSVQWRARYADWNLRSRPFELRWARSWRAQSLSSSFERTDRLVEESRI